MAALRIIFCLVFKNSSVGEVDMKKFLFLFLPLCCVFTLGAADFRIIPTPKKCEFGSCVSFSGAKFSVENKIPHFSPEEMLRDHLAVYGFFPAEKQKGILNIKFVCDTQDSALAKNKEAFKIVIGKEGASVKAATVAGAWRGAARLLAILTSPDSEISDGTLSLPSVTICDYPDISDRAMKIEFPTTSGKELLDLTKPVIRGVAMFGFNMIFFDVRGNLECKKHPELAQAPILPQKDVAELIRYARACGLEVLPMTNTIGHVKRSPLIFPLYGKSTSQWDKPGKKTPVAMDLTHPDFSKVLFAYFDEVLDLFGSPRYFYIGCDEFHDGMKILMKKSGKSFPKLFSDYINECNNYLAKRQCSPIYAQDMLFPRQKPWYVNGPANGPADALQTLDRISKETHIMMWKYTVDPEFAHIGTLQSKGFKNVWAAPWYDPEATAALCKKAYETNCRLLGTTWWYYPQQQGIPTVGEFSWNAANPALKPNSYYDELIDHYFFHRREPAGNIKTTPAQVVGGTAVPQDKAALFSKISPLFSAPRTFDAPELRIKELPDVRTPQELAATPHLGMTFGDSPVILHRNIIRYNTIRSAKELVIYDRSYGKTTRTNPFGAEITIVGDTVTDATSRAVGRYDTRAGNSPIPENGYVLSFHGQIRSVNARLTRELTIRPGKKIKFYQMPDPAIKKTTAKAMICKFSGKKPNVRIYVTTLMPVNPRVNFTCFRFDSRQRGKNFLFGTNRLLSGGAPATGQLHFSAVPHKVDGANPVICIEYRAANKSEYPVRAVFTALKEGAISGFTVLAAEEFD